MARTRGRATYSLPVPGHGREAHDCGVGLASAGPAHATLKGGAKSQTARMAAPRLTKRLIVLVSEGTVVPGRPPNPRMMRSAMTTSKGPRRGNLAPSFPLDAEATLNPSAFRKAVRALQTDSSSSMTRMLPHVEAAVASGAVPGPVVAVLKMPMRPLCRRPCIGRNAISTPGFSSEPYPEPEGFLRHEFISKPLYRHKCNVI